jgi:hypothetical protein
MAITPKAPAVVDVADARAEYRQLLATVVAGIAFREKGMNPGALVKQAADVVKEIYGLAATYAR